MSTLAVRSGVWRWRDFCAASTLATFSFVPVSFLLFLQPHNHYYLRQLPDTFDFLALFLNQLWLTCTFFFVIATVRMASRPWVDRGALCALYAVCGYIASTVRTSIRHPLPFISTGEIFERIGPVGRALVILAAVGAAFYLVVFRARPSLRLAVNVLLVLSPFSALVLGRCAWVVATDQPRVAQRAAVPAAVAPKERVVWIVFDEMDYGLAFGDRPADLALPAFDAFRAESLGATNAYPPARDTLESIPSLMCGRRVERSREHSSSELMLRFAGDSRPVPWTRQPTVFRDAHSLGLRTGVTGWAHPYSRLFADVLDECDWESYVYWGSREGERLGDRMQVQFDMLRGASSTGRWSQRAQKEHHIAAYGKLVDESSRMAGNPALGLVFLHFPVPHPPFVFDRRANRFTLTELPFLEGYAGNLVLADRAFAAVRASMERSGTWDRTTVILTADHWLRGYRPDRQTYWRIPYFIKLAGEQRGGQYRPVLNTVITRDLIQAVLRREVRDRDQLTRWLDARRLRGQGHDTRPASSGEPDADEVDADFPLPELADHSTPVPLSRSLRERNTGRPVSAG